MSEAIISAIVGMLGVVLGAAVAGAYQRRKIAAEVDELGAKTNEQIRQTVMELLNPLDDRVHEQGIEINELRIDLKDWRDCAERRGRQLEKVGIIPSPFTSSRGKRSG